MPETAESHIANLTTNRVCVIEIKNCSSYTLFNPKVFCESGFNHSPPTPTLVSGKQEVCSFTKDDNTASGSAGVLTYDLYDIRAKHCIGRIAIMFSVPFDYNIYKNWIALGLFDSSEACDKKLFDKMYNDKKFVGFVRREGTGAGLKFNKDNVDVRACMNDEGRGIIKLEIYDKLG